MYETLLRSTLEHPFTLTVTGNSCAVTQPDVTSKPKIIRPPLHPHNIHIESKTVQTFASAMTLPEIPLEGTTKTEPKARITLVRPRQMTLEFLKRNSEGARHQQPPEQNSLLKKDEHFILSSRTFSQSSAQGRLFGSKLVDQEKTQDYDIISKRLSSYRSAKDDDPEYAQALLKKLFTNEKILSSGISQAITTIEPIEPTAPDNDEPQRFNNPLRKVNNGKTQRRTSQGKPPSKPLSHRSFKLFEETFTKIPLQQSIGKIKEEALLEIGKEENCDKPQTFREGYVVEKILTSSRRRIKSIQYNKDENIEDKNSYSSSKVINRGRQLRETKNTLTTSGNITERKVSGENEENFLYLRSKSTGNMVRVNPGNMPPMNPPPKVVSKETSLTELSEKQNTENQKILLSCLI